MPSPHYLHNRAVTLDSDANTRTRRSRALASCRKGPPAFSRKAACTFPGALRGHGFWLKCKRSARRHKPAQAKGWQSRSVTYPVRHCSYGGIMTLLAEAAEQRVLLFRTDGALDAVLLWGQL